MHLTGRRMRRALPVLASALAACVPSARDDRADGGIPPEITAQLPPRVDPNAVDEIDGCFHADFPDGSKGILLGRDGERLCREGASE